MLALLLPLLGPILDRMVGLIPDPQAAAKAKADALAQLMEAANRADAAQMEVNKAEAASGSVFVAGWRPFIGWTCGAACAWNWVGLPLGMFVMAAAGQALEIRPLDLSEMLPLLLGMLGMGGLRTFEKVQGVARQTIAKPGAVAPMAQAGGQG